MRFSINSVKNNQEAKENDVCIKGRERESRSDYQANDSMMNKRRYTHQGMCVHEKKKDPEHIHAFILSLLSLLIEYKSCEMLTNENEIREREK